MANTKKIPQPLTKGIAKVPVVMQLEMLECGAASLCMIVHYYKKFLTLEQVRLDCGVSRDGSSAKNILTAARSYGMTANAWKVEPEDLLKEGPFPCIIHWGFNHFVVLCGFKKKKAVINDPAKGRVLVPWSEFDKKYTGVCLTFEPEESFKPEGKKKSVIAFTASRLKGSGKAIAFVSLTTAISSLLGVISPVFSKVFIDRLLSGKNPDWLNPFMAGFCLLIILTASVAWVAKIYSMRIQGKMAAVGSSSYLWKVFRLPMHFFGQRIPGDIADRQVTNASIANTLVSTLAPLTLNAIMAVFYLVVMVKYNLMLSVIGVGAIFINMIVASFITKKRVNITRVQQRDTAKLSGATVSGISMIETIKSSGAERGFFSRWSGFHASEVFQVSKYERTNALLSVIPSLVTSAANLAVLGLGVLLVLQGKFTIGMVMAFQGFLSSFMSPVTSIINAGSSVQEMVTQMERIDDVMEYKEDAVFSDSDKSDTFSKLSGNIEMKNITFGYSKLGAPVIKNFSMTVKPGQKIAFVGQSGCGKSTIAKLLSGLYQPWSGEITFDGKPLSEIDRNVFYGSVSVIDQDITLFEDTVSDNIKMWDNTIEDFEVILAAKDADIHDEIMLRDRGYQHKLSEGGKDFSGGQRQRLEIARALSQDPTICILDEATSALDAKTEYEVVKAIGERGITCVIIAHRLSTIRDCDEIIVLDQGLVVERGTHETLMSKNGFYSRLVTCE